MSEPVIELENVWFRYDEPVVLEDVSLRVARGEFLGVVGPNGGGKTTLLRLILGQLAPERGSVRVLGETPVRARRRIGYVPQRAQFDRTFPISAVEVVLMGRLDSAPWIGGYGRKDREAAKIALDEVEVADLGTRRFGTLSEGQRQRVLIARALVSGPEILLLDEPTASVDQRIEQGIHELLGRLNRRATILIVSHDLGFVTSHVRRVACVSRTLVTHPTSELSGSIIRDVYGGEVRLVRHKLRVES